MKRAYPNDLGLYVQKFFREYLLSLHTIRSYRDALILFLRFVSAHHGRRPEALDLDVFTAERVMQFLTHLEAERHNAPCVRIVVASNIH